MTKTTQGRVTKELANTRTPASNEQPANHGLLCPPLACAKTFFFFFLRCLSFSLFMSASIERVINIEYCGE